MTHEAMLKAAKLRIVPIGYLKKDDRFVATKFALGDGVMNKVLSVVSGVADMDGHMVSEQYGLRRGNKAFCDFETSYINVKFDGATYGPDWVHINDGMYERDGYTFYVTDEVAERVKFDIYLNEAMAQAERTNAASLLNQRKKQQLLDQVAILQKQINEL